MGAFSCAGRAEGTRRMRANAKRFIGGSLLGKAAALFNLLLAFLQFFLQILVRLCKPGSVRLRYLRQDTPQSVDSDASGIWSTGIEIVPGEGHILVGQVLIQNVEFRVLGWA